MYIIMASCAHWGGWVQLSYNPLKPSSTHTGMFRSGIKATAATVPWSGGAFELYQGYWSPSVEWLRRLRRWNSAERTCAGCARECSYLIYFSQLIVLLKQRLLKCILGKLVVLYSRSLFYCETYILIVIDYNIIIYTNLYLIDYIFFKI